VPNSRQRSPDELALAFSGPLRQWLRAVEAEHERIKDDERDIDLRQADAALFVVAVRNVARAARAVAALRKDPQLDAAIAGIDSSVPGARHVRGRLEHVDDYVAHRRRLWPFHRARVGERVVLEPTADRYVVYVGELAFDVEVVTDAARDVADAAFKAIDRMAAGEVRR
jgi:hypothetical protein